MRIRARNYATGEKIDLTLQDGRIVQCERAGSGAVDHEASWVAPALFDLQVNGCHGHNFSSTDLTVEKVRQVIGVCRQHGIGGMFPTLITNSFEAIQHGLATLRRARESDATVAATVPGFHIEGPYISAEDGPRGAHPRGHVRAPDWNEFQRWQEAANGLIKLVTLAPEHETALTFIEQLCRAGIVAALAHTAASPARIRDAIRAGAKLSTHLGNAAHAMLPRHENYIWEQLAADELWASVISDGHHLPGSVLKCMVRVKTPRRTIITCDASSLAGLPPGHYAQAGTEVEVLPSGKVVVPGTPFLAGSGVFTDTCVATMIELAGVSLAEAIDMASIRPREFLGLRIHELKVGQPADLMLFDWQPGSPLTVHQIIQGDSRN
jgi:N-acetylglucosamine-6-phosphate deacetylase